MMLELHPQVLEHKGKKTFVVLPWEEFVAIQEALEDVEDLKVLREARQQNAGQPSLTHEQVERDLGLK